jgi:subtilase family serine protease
MIRTLSTSLLAALLMISVMSIVCAAQPQALLTHHVRDVVANGTAPAVSGLPANQIMRFDIVLALRHAPELESFLQRVYDSSSADYRHFLTPQEFTARFGPSQEDYDALMRFVKAHGFTVLGGSREGRDVQLMGTVAAVEKAFHVTMGVYRHPTENRTFFAPDREPTVDLPFPLWHISGLDNYSIPQRNIKHSNAQAQPQITGSCPGNSYCGSDMRAAYYGTGSLTGIGQNMALLELAGTDLADLSTYYQNVGQTEPYTPTLISTGGYSVNCLASQGCDDTEQTIDMTQEMGMAPGTTMLYMYVCGDGSTFSETACYSAMVSTQDAPLSLQISSSWSWKPADPSTDDPYYQQMASQGQSFFDAAGDGGEWVSGNGRNGFAYPCEDDYVICVGGTDLITNGAGGPWQSETAWSSSGGGISIDGISIPSWQQLAGVIDSQNKGSTTLRNGPDVAAEANQDFYYCSDQSGCGTGLGGTSFAAPMWAGFMALANQQAAANGTPAPGFINPTIYPLALSGGYSAAFHDITSGSNGFPAVTGYDLVTGWGSPNGTGLINALTGPQTPDFSLSANPNSLTVKQGATGTSTITVTDFAGFSGSVTLSNSTLPSGVTAAFNPNPTTNTSTLTFTVGATAATGTTTVTITGVSGSLTHTTTLSLTIVKPDFSLSANPSSLAITQGHTGTSAITITPVNGFNGTVNLSTGTLPSGVTAGFNPNPATSTSTLTFTVAANATTGTTTVTVTGVSGSLTHSTNISLTVNAPVGTISVKPAKEAFAKTLVGQITAAKTVTATNTGTASVTFTGVTVGTANFKITSSTCTGSLLPTKKCAVQVEFTPTQGGALADTLTFADTASNNPQTVALSGTGEALSLNPTFINFNTQTVGTTSASQNVTITNQSSSTVTLTGISLTGSDKGDFLINNSGTTCGASLGNGASCVVSVEFMPSAKSVFTANLQVKSNGGGGAQTVSLEGTGK